MRTVRDSAIQSEINVTPLIDVCLVLLIIFMIVVPAMVNGVDVRLPETSVKSPVDSRVFPVTVKEDGTVYLDTLIVRRDEVLTSLQRLRARESTRPIAVRADKRVEYGEVAKVLGACREAGWSDVALVGVEPQGEGGAPASQPAAPPPSRRHAGRMPA